MGVLQDLNIVKGSDTLAGTIFEELFPSFMLVDYTAPCEYVQIYWDAYLEIREQRLTIGQISGVNGKIFEYILATLLIREQIYPIFMSAHVAFVPNVSYDIMLYSTDRGPICLSAKTSFRERYKQADLEAIALKYVHRRSLSYLITLSEHDAQSVNEKQRLGSVIGLDSAVYALDKDFDTLIDSLKRYNFTDSPTIEVIVANQIVTEETINLVFPNG